MYAVCDPQGQINHTTIAPTEARAIEIWMEQEQTITPILRGTPAQSWEVFEAEGHSVARVDVLSASVPVGTLPLTSEEHLKRALWHYRAQHGKAELTEFLGGYLRLPDPEQKG